MLSPRRALEMSVRCEIILSKILKLADANNANLECEYFYPSREGPSLWEFALRSYSPPSTLAIASSSRDLLLSLQHQPFNSRVHQTVWARNRGQPSPKYMAVGG